MVFLILFALFVVILISYQKEEKKYFSYPKFYNFFKNGIGEEVLIMSFFPLEHTNYFWYGMKRIKERIDSDGVFSFFNKDSPTLPFETKPGYKELVTSWKNENNEEFFVVFVVPIEYVDYFEKVYKEEFVEKRNEVLNIEIPEIIEEEISEEVEVVTETIETSEVEIPEIEVQKTEELEETEEIEEQDCTDFVLVSDQPDQEETSNEAVLEMQNMISNCNNNSIESEIDDSPLAVPESISLSEEEMEFFNESEEVIVENEISEVFENNIMEDVVDVTPENQEDITEEIPEELPDELFEEPILSQEEEKPSVENFEELVLKQEEQKPSTELFEEPVLQQEEDLLQMIPEVMRPIEVKKPIKVLIMKMYHGITINGGGSFEFGEEFKMDIFENMSLPLTTLHLIDILSSDNQEETDIFMECANKNKEIFMIAGFDINKIVENIEKGRIMMPLRFGKKIIVFNHKTKVVPGLAIGLYIVKIPEDN